MTVTLADAATITLAGACSIEDAEPLLQLLLANPQARVDWRACDHAHGAVVQILLIAKAEVLGPPRGAFLADFIAAQIGRSGG
jgi:hypothetical protein